MIERVTLPPQVFCGSMPDPTRFHPAGNYGERPGGHLKPVGGLWTSTWETALDFGWPGWCIREEFELEHLREAWVLKPIECRVLTVASVREARWLDERYGVDMFPGGALRIVEWTRLFERCDAVRLTSPWSRGLRYGPGPWGTTWYSWDCESTFWARWCFAKEEPVRVEVPAAFAPLRHAPARTIAGEAVVSDSGEASELSPEGRTIVTRRTDA